MMSQVNANICCCNLWICWGSGCLPDGAGHRSQRGERRRNSSGDSDFLNRALDRLGPKSCRGRRRWDRDWRGRRSHYDAEGTKRSIYKFIYIGRREPWSSGYGKRLASRNREFESKHCILDGYYLTLYCCKTCIFCLKRPKINEKEAGVAHYKNLNGLNSNCWQVGENNNARIKWVVWQTWEGNYTNYHWAQITHYAVIYAKLYCVVLVSIFLLPF